MGLRWRYLIRRLLSNLLTFWVVVTLIFALFRLLPGDPVAVMVEPLAGEEVRAEVIKDLGLDRPVLAQYGIYLKNLVTGQLQNSFVYRRPVSELITPAFLNTFALAALSLLISYAIGTALGILLAWYRGNLAEDVLTFFTIFLRSSPPFWMATLAVMYFSVRLGVLPISGMHSSGFEQDGLFFHFFTVDFLKHAILPVGVGTLYFLGLPALLMRGTMLEVVGEEYVELAKAKGLSTPAVILRHAARNAILPVLTAGSLFLGWAMGGLVAIEYIFSWPGLGQQMVQALGHRDYPLAQGAFILTALLIMVINFATDVLLGWLDPRIELK